MIYHNLIKALIGLSKNNKTMNSVIMLKDIVYKDVIQKLETQHMVLTPEEFEKYEDISNIVFGRMLTIGDQYSIQFDKDTQTRYPVFYDIFIKTGALQGLQAGRKTFNELQVAATAINLQANNNERLIKLNSDFLRLSHAVSYNLLELIGSENATEIAKNLLRQESSLASRDAYYSDLQNLLHYIGEENFDEMLKAPPGEMSDFLKCCFEKDTDMETQSYSNNNFCRTIQLLNSSHKTKIKEQLFIAIQEKINNTHFENIENLVIQSSMLLANSPQIYGKEDLKNLDNMIKLIPNDMIKTTVNYFGPGLEKDKPIHIRQYVEERLKDVEQKELKNDTSEQTIL